MKLKLKHQETQLEKDNGNLKKPPVREDLPPKENPQPQRDPQPKEPPMEVGVKAAVPAHLARAVATAPLVFQTLTKHKHTQIN